MAERVMDFDLAAEIVQGIEARVGKVGERTVNTSIYGERFGAIALSRGGIVVPDLSVEEDYVARRREHRFTGGDRIGQLIYPGAPSPRQPVFHPELAVVTQSVGALGYEGYHSDGNVMLSDIDSREYVFRLGDDGLWRAFDSFGQSSDNYRTRTKEYFLEAARPIETDEEGIAIKVLMHSFDMALARQASNAVDEATGLLRPGF